MTLKIQTEIKILEEMNQENQGNMKPKVYWWRGLLIKKAMEIGTEEGD